MNIQEVPIKTLIKNLEESGGHPNETEDTSDRNLYIEEFTRRGVDNILKELGYSLDRNTLWRNKWTGHEEPLKYLIMPDEYGAKNRGETEDNQIMFALENWIPAVGRNIIKEEYERKEHAIRLEDGSIQAALI